MLTGKMPRQPETVEKPSVEHLASERLQKSAVTKADTVRESCASSMYTPKDKQPKYLHDESDFSDKLTPVIASAGPAREALGGIGQRRATKLQGKEQNRARRAAIMVSVAGDKQQ